MVSAILFVGTASTLMMGGHSVQAAAGADGQPVISRQAVPLTGQTDGDEAAAAPKAAASAALPASAAPTATTGAPAQGEVAPVAATSASEATPSSAAAPEASSATSVASGVSSAASGASSATSGNSAAPSLAASAASAAATSAALTAGTGTASAADNQNGLSMANLTTDNYAQAFNFNGTAKYDQTTKTVTLTDDVNQEAGSITLKDKISLSQSFVLKGELNIGARDQISHGGGDGVAFGFHDANSDLVGLGGAGLGLAGIPDAIGWKADTTYNWVDSNQAGPDPSAFSNGPEAPNSPGYGGGLAFGAFIKTAKNVIGLGQGLPDAGHATTIADGAQAIDSPAPGFKEDPTADPTSWQGDFRYIEIDYNPNDGGRKLLTVIYDGKRWQMDITDWAADKTDTAFFISAGTAANANLQQFKLDSFTFHPAATVDVKYEYTTDSTVNDALEKDPTATVDPKTLTEIPGYVGLVDYPTGAFVDQQYLTYPQSIPGYRYVRLYETSIPANGSLSLQGNNGTVIYLYRKTGNGGQKALIQFWDGTEHKELGQPVTVEGDSNTLSDYSDGAAIAAYKQAGYQYDPYYDQTVNVDESGGLHNAIYFDDDNKTTQKFNVYLFHDVQNTPEQESFTRTIKYVRDTDGSQLYPTVYQNISFTISKTIDKVANTTTYNNPSYTFEYLASPRHIRGWLPDIDTVSELTFDMQHVPTQDQLNVVVKYHEETGLVPNGILVKTKVGMPPAVHEPTGRVPNGILVKTKVGMPPAVHEPTGRVPNGILVKTKVGMPPAIHEPTGRVPNGILVKTKVGMPPAVHEPTGRVPNGILVKTKVGMPPAIHEPTGRVPNGILVKTKVGMPPAVHEPTGRVPNGILVKTKVGMPPAVHEPTGRVPNGILVKTKVGMPPAVHEPTGRVPNGILVKTKVGMPPAVHEPTGRVPHGILVKTKVGMPPAVHEPTGRVPNGILVKTKVGMPPAVHEPTGRVPHGILVKTKVGMPPAVHEPTGRVPNGILVKTKVGMPPAVHEPTGRVPHGILVKTKVGMPPAVHEPTGRVPNGILVKTKVGMPPAVHEPTGRVPYGILVKTKVGMPPAVHAPIIHKVPTGIIVKTQVPPAVHAPRSRVPEGVIVQTQVPPTTPGSKAKVPNGPAPKTQVPPAAPAPNGTPEAKVTVPHGEPLRPRPVANDRTPEAIITSTNGSSTPDTTRPGMRHVGFNRAKLPSTGDRENVALTGIGAMVSIIFGVLGLTKKRQRRTN